MLVKAVHCSPVSLVGVDFAYTVAANIHPRASEGRAFPGACCASVLRDTGELQLSTPPRGVRATFRRREGGLSPTKECSILGPYIDCDTGGSALTNPSGRTVSRLCRRRQEPLLKQPDHSTGTAFQWREGARRAVSVVWRVARCDLPLFCG